MSDFVVECSALAKSFTDGASHVQVLQHVDLQVKPGELIAIVGNSGLGKSTLLHLLAGLDKPTSGSVIVDGKHLAKLSEHGKCRLRNHAMGFVYQFHHLLPEFTALENVCMPLLIRKEQAEGIEEKALHLLDQVGLKERVHHKIGQLSGGERQRVAIARALVTDPLCVLADEPTGNLDANNAANVLKLFFELQKSKQTSVIMVTHDMKIAEQAQRVLLLRNGKLDLFG